MPGGVEGDMPALSRSEERALARESTAGFADWVTSLFRRVLALCTLFFEHHWCS
jgi:proteasome activator subunit 4